MEEKVLIVDDDPSIQRLLKKVMLSNQLAADVAGSAEQALAMLRTTTYALILMDITMEGMDGFEAVEQIRAARNMTPIIIVSGKNEDYDTLYGLELGADDYVTKPFNPVILGAKVKALIRRNEQAQSSSSRFLAAGPFRFNKSTLRLQKNGEEIPLSSKETRLMAFFLEHPGQVFSKGQIYQQVWNDDFVDENTVTVHINHLRAKIEDTPKNPRHLITVWGLGYKFIPEAE
ncbi:MAG: response regulator transcription factor [Lachnospiraceae bacterium]|nr:response regulator transcription factor [Lachnospiraceae bacterium]